MHLEVGKQPLGICLQTIPSARPADSSHTRVCLLYSVSLLGLSVLSVFVQSACFVRFPHGVPLDQQHGYQEQRYFIAPEGQFKLAGIGSSCILIPP